VRSRGLTNIGVEPLRFAIFAPRRPHNPARRVRGEEEEESLAFADRACQRIGKGRLEVSGELRALKIRVEGSPPLLINGREEEAAVKDGFLTFPRAQASR
jgi:hypothetical protein